ncbi:MAG: hypothetical protein CMP10_21400 [Zetaproteobacteria bacterium]|nr:hypothetical protein [Pseudobdellovibrionaceae bacterium]
MTEESNNSPMPKDWFVDAIGEGITVENSLRNAIKTEEKRVSFLKSLQVNLCTYRGKSSDSITELSRRVNDLDVTLNFRIGLLNPVRSGAWFRESMSSQAGPFTTRVLSEPVFAPFESHQVEGMKNIIRQSWNSGKMKMLPFTKQGPCLWLTLLELNQCWESLAKLDSPWQNFRLDEVGVLPEELQSPYLEIYLHNVEKNIKSVKVELDACFNLLWKASSEFWDHFAKKNNYRSSARSTHEQRQKFKERRKSYSHRSHATRYNYGHDDSALKFMEFAELPSLDQLKKRYRDLARVMHPDLAGGNGDAFNELHRSYTYLYQKITA